jgi:signal transduction histidine kinase
MLDISRISHGKLILSFEEVDLGQLATQVVASFQEQIAAVGAQCAIALEAPVVGHWDRYRLEQVLANLITNAIKYGAGKPIHLSVGTRGDLAILKVKDQGMGIPREGLERIFERFERAVTGVGIAGLGLGLYICRQIVEAHGGKISAESELGIGSTFTVEIPLRSR